jgi:signal transduction histidine kinase
MITWANRNRHWTIDAVIAVVAIAVGLLGAYRSGAWHGHGHRNPSTFVIMPVVLGGVSLLGRRRFPVAVLAVTLASAMWAVKLDVWTAWPALIVAFFTAVLARKRAAAVTSLVIGYIVVVWPPWRIGSPGHTSGVGALGLLAWLTVLLSAAELARIRRQRAIDIASRREEETRRRASEQRLAIARDLHDVVAHNISVINVQANTALHLMDRQPERAREALTAIHDVSKQALAELRSVLGVLRTEPDGAVAAAPRAPSPGLDRLPELASGTAGIAVKVITDGSPRPMPTGVDVAAYRIIQEALTNSVRHSGGSTATIRLVYDEDALTISVDDDGNGNRHTGGMGPPSARPVRMGNGVAGMTERARALGGTLEAGPRPEGGFRVLARLPA